MCVPEHELCGLRGCAGRENYPRPACRGFLPHPSTRGGTLPRLPTIRTHARPGPFSTPIERQEMAEAGGEIKSRDTGGRILDGVVHGRGGVEPAGHWNQVLSALPDPYVVATATHGCSCHGCKFRATTTYPVLSAGRKRRVQSPAINERRRSPWLGAFTTRNQIHHHRFINYSKS